MQEPWIERVIREAQEAGTFDGLAGSGKPIPDIDRPYEASWWARRWVRAERTRAATVELARHVEAELPRLLASIVEDRVRAGLESLNTKIERHNKGASEVNGLPLLDIEGLLNGWVARRGG